MITLLAIFINARKIKHMIKIKIRMLITLAFILILFMTFGWFTRNAKAKAIYTSTWYITDTLLGNHGVEYEKTYDENTNIVCYATYYSGTGTTAISCLKNI